MSLVSAPVLSPVAAIPLQREPDSLFKRKPRRVPEISHRRADIRLRVSYVAGARRPVTGWNLHSLDPLQQRPGLVQSDPPAVARVVHLAGNPLRPRRLQVQLRDVVHVREIARLL